MREIRLALETGRAVLERFVDGAWIVELAALSDAALVPQAVAKVLEVPEQPRIPMTATLLRALRTKVMLLIHVQSILNKLGFKSRTQIAA